MINIVLQGLGAIGRKTLERIAEDPNLNIVGAIDTLLTYRGMPVNEIIGAGPDIKVSEDLVETLGKLKEDGKNKNAVLVVTTDSRLEKVLPSLMTAIEYGFDVVSPAEELFYPEYIDPIVAGYVDKLARENGVRILGGGVNPGCLMDRYPAFLLEKYRKEHSNDFKVMEIYRWDDTLHRRLPLLKKTGTGLTEAEFRKSDKEGNLGHVGLRLSSAYLAHALGWDIKDSESCKTTFERTPVIAQENIELPDGRIVQKGRVAGLHELCLMTGGNRQEVRLSLKMYVGAKNKNCTTIIGPNGSKTTCDYSNIVNGDIATIRILREMIYRAVEGPAGLNRVEYVPDPTVLLAK